VLGDLEVTSLNRVLRPTMLIAVGLGAVGFVVAALISQPLAAVGIAIGVGLGVVNFRLLAAGVVKLPVDGTDTKLVKRLMRSRSLLRLTVLTAVVIVGVLIAPALGMGLAIGLVLFQLAFVASAGRAVLREGIS